MERKPVDVPLLRIWVSLLKAMGSCCNFVGTEILTGGNYWYSNFTDYDVDVDSSNYRVPTLEQALVSFPAPGTDIIFTISIPV